MAKEFKGFAAEALRFLSDLRENNNREWFLAHKHIYERALKEPMVELVEAVGSALQLIAPELVTDPRKAIYRIYRDIRFSPDKSPYKTHAAALFAPRGLPKHGGAALYFHLSPEELLIAGGVYMPAAPDLLAIRQHVADHYMELRKIISAPDFRRRFGELEGESTSRTPKGFAPDQPGMDLIRYKQYLVAVTKSPRFSLSSKFLPFLLESFALMIPFIRFLNAPLLNRAVPYSGPAGPPL